MNIKVATKTEVPPGGAKKIEIEGKEIALFNIGGQFYAIDDACSHRGGPLSEGAVEDKVVACPWHGWQYDVTSGECLTNPGVCQTKYDVAIEGEDVFINI